MDTASSEVPKPNPSEFADLVEQLVDLEQLRTGSMGLSGDAAVKRTRIERRLMHLLCAEVAPDERRSSIRVPSHLAVQARHGNSVATGRLTNVGVGGAFIDTPMPVAIGDEVVIVVERQRGSFEHSFQLRARVAWLASSDGRACSGFGVSFSITSDADERRLRRLVLDLLREHIPSPHE